MKHHNLFWAFCGGFFGTLVMTLLEYMFRSLTSTGIDMATMLGSVIHPGIVSLSAGNHAWEAVGNGAWEVGLIWNFVNGTIVFPLLYAYFIYKWMPRSRFLNETLRGAMWGAVLWVFLEVVAMPVFGFGVFGANMRSSVVIASEAFFLQVIYGALFGFIAGIQARREPLSARAAPGTSGMPLEHTGSH